MSPDGWLADVESKWLAEQAHDKSLVIEFGSWCGKSTLALACAKRVVCVDTWLGTPGDIGGHEQRIADGFRPIAEWREFTKHLPNVIGIVGNLRDPGGGGNPRLDLRSQGRPGSSSTRPTMLITSRKTSGLPSGCWQGTVSSVVTTTTAITLESCKR